MPLAGGCGRLVLTLSCGWPGPCVNIANWWPPGHMIGYEHGFTHAAADFLRAVDQDLPIEPNFSDGVKCIQVLDAGIRSAKEGRKVILSST